ncbi:MAG: hypothetical protein QM817_25620 [Archangium sp.]
MAPRIRLTAAHVVAELKRHAKHLEKTPYRFGSPHHSRAVVKEEGRFRVRLLELKREKADAYLKEHGMFMPEHAEMLSEPTGPIELDFATLDELISALEKSKYQF